MLEFTASGRMFILLDPISGVHMLAADRWNMSRLNCLLSWLRPVFVTLRLPSGLIPSHDENKLSECSEHLVCLSVRPFERQSAHCSCVIRGQILMKFGVRRTRTPLHILDIPGWNFSSGDLLCYVRSFMIFLRASKNMLGRSFMLDGPLPFVSCPTCYSVIIPPLDTV
jgi:hypothetical protein